MATGWNGRLRSDEYGDCVVHIQQFWHVLCRGQDEGYEGLGSVSIGAVLRVLWVNADFQ